MEKFSNLSKLSGFRVNVAGIGDKIIYNSSVNIESDLIGKPQKFGMKTMELQPH